MNVYTYHARELRISPRRRRDKYAYPNYVIVLLMTLSAEHLDTLDSIEELKLKLIGSLSPQERFERMNRLCAFGKLAMLEGLKEKHPDLNEKSLLILLARNLWGNEFANHIAAKLNKIAR